jgi:hypothetical protein
LYIERLKQYFVANDVEDGPKQRAILISCVGDRTYRTIKDVLSPTSPTEADFKTIVDKMTAHFQPEPSEIVQRFRFHTRIRQSHESVATYIAQLKQVAENCNFGDAARVNEMLRDRLVCRIANEKWQQCLLAEDDLSYDKAQKLLLSMEAAEKGIKDLAGDPAKKVQYFQNKKNQGHSSGKPVDHKAQPCKHCGGPHAPLKCRFRGAECHYCHKRGHTAPICCQRLHKQQQQQQQSSTPFKKPTHSLDAERVGTPPEYDDPMNNIHAVPSVESRKPYVVQVIVHGKPVCMEVDTGATLSVMTHDTYLATWGSAEAPLIKPSSAHLCTYTGQTLTAVGMVEVDVQYGEQQATLNLVIVDGKGPPLLGRDWLAVIRLDWGQFHKVEVEVNGTLEAVLGRHSTLFKAGLGTIHGLEAKLYLKDGAKAKFCRVRQVPFAVREKVEIEIDRQVALGILEPVKFSEWATPVVPIMKKDGSVRLCGDYKITVNQATETDTYPLPRIEDMLASVAGGTVFSTLDLAHAYQQVVLDEESQRMVTITTHKGLYRVKRLPFGVASAPSMFQRIMESVLQGIPGVIVYIDDILVSGKDNDDHLQTLNVVLSRLEEAGLKLKRSKCSFLLPLVEYLGYRITKDGLQPTSKKVEAVQKSPAPKDVSQLKSFIGLVNYYGKFLPDLSTVLAPLYRLLQKETEWRWTDEQQRAFEEVKVLLTSDRLLVHYDPDKELVLACDASPYGIGAVLSHRDPDGRERPIAFASRTLAPAERNYSQLEKEGLAIVFGVKRFHAYLFGRHFIILSDHKPLRHLFKENSATPPLASARIQRWALTLGGYDYTIEYKPGESHSNADFLSRLPLPETSQNIPVPHETVFLMETLNSSPVTASQIKQWTSQDPLLSKVRDLIQHGGLNRNKEAVSPFHQFERELSVQDGCILCGSRVVVPPDGRRAVIELLHEGHPGNNRMKGLARSFVWWPGIDHDIEECIRECEPCQQSRHNPAPAPLHPWEFPSAPWERLHADFAGPFLGHTFFLVIDAHSKWLEAKVISPANSATTIEQLRSIFATHGLPKVFVTDNGPRFTSAEFAQFMTTNGIRHVTSSPYHPASNGLAERAVQVFKESMKRQPTSDSIDNRLSKFLLWYRLTPHSTTGVAPAELLMGRRPRSVLDLLKPDVADRVKTKQEAQKTYHDRTAKYREFRVGDAVFVRDFSDRKRWIPGVVSDKKGPSSYYVSVPDGRVLRRHVEHIRIRTCTSTDTADTDMEIPYVPSPQRTAPPETNDPTPPPRRSTRIRAPPDYYRSET